MDQPPQPPKPLTPAERLSAGVEANTLVFEGINKKIKNEGLPLTDDRVAAIQESIETFRASGAIDKEVKVLYQNLNYKLGPDEMNSDIKI